MATSKTNTTRISDLIKWENRREYCRDSVTFNNDTGGELNIDDPMGLPVIVTGTQAVPAQAGEEANVTGLLLYDKPISGLANGDDLNDGQFVTVLARGPALVNEDAIPANDDADAAYTLATIKTTLEALNIRFVSEGDVQEVQTT